MSKFRDISFVERSDGSFEVEWSITCPKSLPGIKNSGGIDIKVRILLHFYNLLIVDVMPRF